MTKFSVDLLFRKISGSPPGISNLIRSILHLEDRLSTIDQESEYFQWALDRQCKKLVLLRMRYQSVRETFNDVCVDELSEALHHSQSNSIRRPVTFPVFAKTMLKNMQVMRTVQIKDFLQMKGITEVLPDVDHLRDDPELLEKLMHAHHPD